MKFHNKNFWWHRGSVYYVSILISIALLLEFLDVLICFLDPVCKFVAAFVFELPQASSFPAMDIVRDMHCSFRSVERTTNDLVHCCLQFLRGLCVIYRNTSMQYTSCIISGTYF